MIWLFLLTGLLWLFPAQGFAAQGLWDEAPRELEAVHVSAYVEGDEVQMLVTAQEITTEMAQRSLNAGLWVEPPEEPAEDVTELSLVLWATGSIPTPRACRYENLGEED